MSRYAPLVSLLIEHEFFVDSRCQALSCQPDPGSINFARDCDLVLKTHADGATVYLDHDRTAASADRLYKDTINGQEASVSDIYINC